MGFNTVLDKARELTNSASDAVSKLLDEFNAALPTMKALGFGVEDLHVAMGVLPEVKAKLVASADNVDVKAINGMIDKMSEQKTLVVVLKALQTAYNVRGQLGDLGLKGVEIDLTLGLPPKVSIGFMKKTAVSAPTLATATA
jgi:predicted regulator of amino acid metabolism with ACT domain